MLQLRTTTFTPLVTYETKTMLLAVPSRPRFTRGLRRSPRRVRWLRLQTTPSCRRTHPRQRGFQANSFASGLRVPRVVLQRLPDCLVAGLLTRQPHVEGWFGFRRTATRAIVTFLCRG
jgi:hypothetical protein